MYHSPSVRAVFVGYLLQPRTSLSTEQAAAEMTVGKGRKYPVNGMTWRSGAGLRGAAAMPVTVTK